MIATHEGEKKAQISNIKTDTSRVKAFVFGHE